MLSLDLPLVLSILKRSVSQKNRINKGLLPFYRYIRNDDYGVSGASYLQIPLY
jgi:hypothetical protein